jgi:hypothetical protein
VANFVALLAFHALSRTRLSALLRRVAFLFAVAASERVDSFLGTVTGTVTLLVAVDTLNDRLRRYTLNLLLLAVLSKLAWTVGVEVGKTHLADVTKLAAVAAQGNTTVLDEASGNKTLQVLLRRLGPAFSQLGTTGLCRVLEGENPLTFRVADRVDDGHVGSNGLLLRHQVDWGVVLTKSLLDGGQVELRGDGTGVCSKTETESIEVFGVRCIDESLPSFLGSELGNAIPVDHAALIAVEGFVAGLVAQLALLGRAVTSGMTIDTARVAGTSKGTLDSGVSAVSFVVADLTAVVAFASQAATSGLLRTVPSEVTGLAASGPIQSYTVNVLREKGESTHTRHV